jgi:hypothetical protein
MGKNQGKAVGSSHAANVASAMKQHGKGPAAHLPPTTESRLKPPAGLASPGFTGGNQTGAPPAPPKAK